jgi:hypothetical protein
MSAKGIVPAAIIMMAISASGVRTAAGQTSETRDVFTLDGTCSRLVVQGNDITDQCQDSVMYMMLPVGRVVFMFFAEDGRVVVFSGDERLVQNPNADSFFQPIDIARTGYHEEDTASFAVSGACAGTNPFVGVATLECRAAVDGAVFAATFRSDGRPPDDLR